MISAIETTFSLKSLKILRPKVTKILGICLKKFCESLPMFLIRILNKDKRVRQTKRFLTISTLVGPVGMRQTKKVN